MFLLLPSYCTEPNGETKGEDGLSYISDESPKVRDRRMNQEKDEAMGTELSSPITVGYVTSPHVTYNAKQHQLSHREGGKKKME